MHRQLRVAATILLALLLLVEHEEPSDVVHFSTMPFVMLLGRRGRGRLEGQSHSLGTAAGLRPSAPGQG